MNRTAGYRAKHLQRKRRKTGGRRVAAGGKEDGALLRLVICGAVFVLLVALKLLFPRSVSALSQSAGQLLGRDADFKEAFAAVGRAVSGEEAPSESLQDAYTAVFGSAEIPAEAAAAFPAETEGTASGEQPQEMGQDTAEVVTGTAEQQPQPETVGSGSETGAEIVSVEVPVEDVVTDTISYVYTMPPLPENASLEQRNLGFSCASPLVGTMTSPFGWREHPIEGEDRFHYGLDLAAETGTDICAFADGTVYATGESSTLGKYIMLEHPGGYITLYAHCDRVTVTGGSVVMGQKIAEVGQTGAATGPHLHFELHDGKLYLNPIYYVEVG